MLVHLVPDGIQIRTAHTSRLTKQSRMPDKVQYYITAVVNKDREIPTVLCYNTITEVSDQINFITRK
jgi:hypothetical protein